MSQLVPGGGTLRDPLPGNMLGDPNFWSLWRTTRFADKDGSPDIQLYNDRGQINRTIWVCHDNIDQAITDFYGSVTLKQSDFGTFYLSRIVPHNWPKRPWMWVQSASQITPQVMRPYNFTNPITLADFQARDVDGTPTYWTAEVQLQYIFPTFKIKADDDPTVVNPIIGDKFQGLPDEGNALQTSYRLNSRYVTRIIKMATKMLTIPRGLVADSNKKTIAENIAINEHVGELIYTWHQVPEEALPQTQWIAGANSVNDSTFDGRPAGTLLFTNDPELRMTPNPITGQYLYDVTYRFHSLITYDKGDPLNPKGHNYIRRSDPNAGGPGVSIFRPLLFGLWFTPAGGGPQQQQVMFPSFDFRRLFRPDNTYP